MSLISNFTTNSLCDVISGIIWNFTHIYNYIHFWQIPTVYYTYKVYMYSYYSIYIYIYIYIYTQYTPPVRYKHSLYTIQYLYTYTSIYIFWLYIYTIRIESILCIHNICYNYTPRSPPVTYTVQVDALCIYLYST